MNFEISPEIYPPEKEKANKETIWEHYFARKIAFLILPFFLKLKISANQVSILSIITGIVGAILIAVGNFWQILLGASLLQIWLILDKTDGLIARYRKSISSFGKFLEELNGAVIAALFFSSIGFAASKFPGFPISLQKIPSIYFVIFGISTSFFVIFRQLIFNYFDAIFSKEEKTKSQTLFGEGFISIFYKTILKFSGIYSLAQPILILAIIFNFLGLYILFYFFLQFLIMLSNIIFLSLKASKL
jgi:phosphatidylglycerophosphate synthase